MWDFCGSLVPTLFLYSLTCAKAEEEITESENRLESGTVEATVFIDDGEEKAQRHMLKVYKYWKYH